MMTPVRITSNVKPNLFEDLGNGIWYYNFDIQSEQVTSFMNENNIPVEETRYNYVQVRIPGRPNYKKCVEAIIREYITQSQEFDLINSYNRVHLNLVSEEESTKVSEEYKEYLNKVTRIKEIIKRDFKQSN